MIQGPEDSLGGKSGRSTWVVTSQREADPHRLCSWRTKQAKMLIMQEKLQNQPAKS